MVRPRKAAVLSFAVTLRCSTPPRKAESTCDFVFPSKLNSESKDLSRMRTLFMTSRANAASPRTLILACFKSSKGQILHHIERNCSSRLRKGGLARLDSQMTQNLGAEGLWNMMMPLGVNREEVSMVSLSLSGNVSSTLYPPHSRSGFIRKGVP